MKTLFIHIGLHKTGSTALQLWMRHNDKILASHGVFVPKVGTFNEESGHHRVAWEMRDDKRNEGQNHHIDDLVNELVLCPCQKALISSEDFEYLSTAPVRLIEFQEKIKSLGWKTEYVAYVRNAIDYAVSLYHELLKHDENVTTIDYLRQLRRSHSYTTRSGWFFDFNHNRLVRKWEDVFKSPLLVVSYDDVIQGGGILPPMLDILGISRVTNFPSPIARINVSPSQSNGLRKTITDFLIKTVARHSVASESWR